LEQWQVGGNSTLLDRSGEEAEGALSEMALHNSMRDGVEVTALTAGVRVSIRRGLLMAAIPAGRRMNFAMQAAATASLTRTGCLLYKENHFIIQDSETQEVVELAGQDLALNAGNRVEVTGTAGTAKPVVTLATRVLNVTAVAPRSRGGCITVASTLGASTEAPSSGAVPAAPQAPKASKTVPPRKR
jgi:hypothetical protein